MKDVTVEVTAEVTVDVTVEAVEVTAVEATD